MTTTTRSGSEGWGLLPLRLVVASVFLMHGGQKLFYFGYSGVTDMLTKLGFPIPGFFALVLLVLEPLGGLSILLGVLARWAGLLLAIEMSIAIPVARLKGGFFTPYGFEFELTLLGACLTIAVLGVGAPSLDRVLRRPRPQ